MGNPHNHCLYCSNERMTDRPPSWIQCFSECLARYYFWPRVQEYVAKYVKECQVCEGVKSLNQYAAGLLQPLPCPVKPWDITTTNNLV